MPRASVHLMWALLCGACAPLNFPELAEDRFPQTGEIAEISIPEEAIAAAELALLGHHDIKRSYRHIQQALALPNLSQAERTRAALALAYLGVLDGRPKWVQQAVEAGLPTAPPEDATLFLAILRPYWGRFRDDGPVPSPLRAAIDGVLGRFGEAWICPRIEAGEHVLTMATLTPGQSGLDQAARQAGLANVWRVSAPWGAQPTLDMQATLGPEKRALKAVEQVRDGYRDVSRAPWMMRPSDGELVFFDIPAKGGIGFAQATIELPEGATERRAILSLESNRPVSLFANGQLALELGQGVRVEGWTRSVGLTIPVTGLLLTVKMSTNDGSGFVRLRATGMGEVLPAFTLRPTATSGPLVRPQLFDAPECSGALGKRRPTYPDAAGVIKALLTLEVLNARPYRATDAAWRLHTHLKKVLNYPGLGISEVRLLAKDKALGTSLARGKRRILAKEILASWPDHVGTSNLMAKLRWASGRVKEALDLWKGALDKRPDHVPTLIALLNAYSSKSWRREGLAVATRLEALAAGGPRVLQEVFDFYHRFGLSSDAERVAQRLFKAYPRSGLTRYARRTGAQSADGPLARADLLQRLWKAATDRLDVAQKAFELLLAAGKTQSAERLLAQVRDIRPDDPWSMGAAIELALAGSPSRGWRESLKRALSARPSDSRLQRLSRWLSGKSSPIARLDDGRKVLSDFRSKFGKDEVNAYSAYPIINVLDRMDSIVVLDGSVWTLTHVLRLVQTKSGVDKIGEIRPPEGSLIVELRTIKADGSVLWPERVSGKKDISFSGLEPGDAVEWAWLRRDRARQDEGGYLTGISFAQWGIPTWRKRASLSLPPNLGVTVKLRNGAPTPKLSADAAGSTVYTWEEEDLAPAPREPRAANARFFFPYVDLALVARGGNAGSTVLGDPWHAIQRAYRGRVQRLLRRGFRTEQIARRFKKIADPIERLKSAALWVQREVKATESFNHFVSPLEHAIARKKGNRALVYKGLLNALGATSDLLLCAPVPHGPPPDADDPVPNANRYWYPIVAIEQEGKAHHVDLADANTPFGFLPASLYGASCMSVSSPAKTVSLVTLPAAPPERLDWRLELVARVDEQGATRLSFVGRGRGPATNALRKVYSRADAPRQRLIWQQWINWMVPGARLVSFKVSGATKPESDLIFEVQASMSGLFQRQSKGLRAQGLVKSVWARHFSTFPALNDLVSLPERDTPLRLDAHAEEFVLRLHGPAGWKVTSTMKSLDVSTPAGEIQGSQSVSGTEGSLRLERRIRVKGAIVWPLDYPAFRSRVLAAHSGWNGSFTMTPE